MVVESAGNGVVRVDKALVKAGGAEPEGGVYCLGENLMP